MDSIALIITDEVSKSVAVLELNIDRNLPIDLDEFMYNLQSNTEFTNLFLQAVKEDLADDEAKYSIGQINYFSMENVSQIQVFQKYLEEENTLEFYVTPISIYSKNSLK